MAELPLPINHTTEAIYRAIKARGWGGDNRGVAMSEAANECDRAIWYALRWATPRQEVDGQKQSRFDTGRYWEDRLLGDLEAIGCDVQHVDPATGKQFAVELANGWLRGKLDALATGIPEAPKTVHVVECKSHSEKSFKELLKHQPPKGEGLAKSKPDHYLQCQLYCLKHGATRCLYLAVNKNDDARYAERIEFNATFALAAEARIERLAPSDKAPPRLWDDPTSKGAFACGWCPAKGVCHERQFARVNCRTCLSARFDAGANVFCTLHQRELSYDEQRAGCGSHLFLPDLVAGEQIDADPEARTVTYRLASGEIWVDGGSK